MDSAAPRFELPVTLKFMPLLRAFENVNVRLHITGRRLFFQFLYHYAIMKLRLDGDRGGNVTVNVVVDEMFRLRVLPLFRMNRQGDFPKWIRVPLADLVGAFLSERVKAGNVRLLGRRHGIPENEAAGQQER